MAGARQGWLEGKEVSEMKDFWIEASAAIVTGLVYAYLAVEFVK